MIARPWQKFRVGAPSTRENWVEPDCQPITAVAHVTHVPIGLRIIDDQQVRADLVYDKSKLNSERIRVVWLSPNDWHNAGGFRYGNVRFWFDWKTLIAGKRYYWVESIAYGIEACRLLVTDIDHGSTLEPYDPASGEGPWWLGPGDQHYWNGKFCLEIMYEGDLAMSLVQDVDFVKHHPNRCNIDPNSCVYRGSTEEKAGALFVALIARNGASCRVPGFVDTTNPTLRAGSALYSATSRILLFCDRVNGGSWGDVGKTNSLAMPLARAFLNSAATTGFRKDSDSAMLAALFQSSGDLQFAVATAIAETFGLTDVANLLEWS